LGDLPFTSPDEPAVWEDFDNVPWDGLGTVLEQSSLVRPAAGSTPLIRPEAGEWAAFSGGSVGGPVALGDYLGSSGGTDHPATGLAALAEIDSISILCVPDDVHPAHRGIASGITEAIVRQCEALRDRFAVLQLPRDAGGGDPNSIAPPAQSGFAAVYHPWLRVADDLAAATRFVPPGGHIAGIYARTDSSRGIHKSTANEQVLGTVAGPGGEVPLDPEIGELEQDLLARRNINIIRDFRTMGRGIRVWGARTLTADPEWKYVSVRRLVMWLEKSIHRGTAWVEFEPNAAPTWQRVRQQVAAFLTEEWRKGALLGSKPEEAFFVNVDRTTMTQDDIATGRLVAVVGVAPLRPAEFVIFRIGQKTADATR
jgi:phage tail sheath protein FI